MMSIEEELNTLVELRNSINNYDKQILKLLEKRIEAAQKIGIIKRKNNKPIYAPEVEKEKIAVLAKECQCPGLVETIWPVIMCYTRSIE